MKILEPSDSAIRQAAEALQNGLLVAFPTETVYGLGAAALCPSAMKRLYAAKGRPTNHPVIIHIIGPEQLLEWASHVPDGAMRLAEALWPGPLTLILKRSAQVPDAVTGGQDTVGLRVPNHRIALALLKSFAGGVAAPSANKFGRLSPTSAEDVAHDFAEEVEIVLDGGSCDIGIESTIVDYSSDSPRILRPGMIMPEQIEKISGAKLDSVVRFGAAAQNVRVPGGLPSHYAPNTPLRIVDGDALAKTVRSIIASGKKVCVLAFQSPAQNGSEPAQNVPWIVAAAAAHSYARQLYSNLRKLDRERADLILVETVPSSADWEGISDRLRRASAQTDSLHRGDQ